MRHRAIHNMIRNYLLIFEVKPHIKGNVELTFFGPPTHGAGIVQSAVAGYIVYGLGIGSAGGSSAG